jgi:hypothetical protein
MRGRGRREGWPLWVRAGLWGVTEPAAAWTFFGGSAALALAGLGLGFVHPAFFAGAGFALAAVWYYLCIRWVGRNGSWSAGRSGTSQAIGPLDAGGATREDWRGRGVAGGPAVTDRRSARLARDSPAGPSR